MADNISGREEEEAAAVSFLTTSEEVAYRGSR